MFEPPTHITMEGLEEKLGKERANSRVEARVFPDEQGSATIGLSSTSAFQMNLVGNFSNVTLKSLTFRRAFSTFLPY